MAVAGQPDVGAALARLESLLAGSQGPRVPDRPDPASIRWVCLVPVWTPVLAARCGMPGWSGASDLELLEAWRNEGLIEAMLTPLSIDDAGQVTPAQHLFWVPRNARPAWLARIVSEDGRDRLAALAQEIARRILAQPRDQHMPTAAWRWAVVASQTTSPAPTLQQTLDRELDQALAMGRPDEAWMWIEALQRVADVVPGEATTLHQRAVRRLALFDRERADRAMLRDYLPRPALFEAYRALLTGPDDVWATHYLGGGGVGKTMLMRALTSGTAQHLPAGFDVPPTVTARIDFDHIDPDYPARRPGLLFAHLAEELRLKDEGLRASEGFALLFSKIALMHERTGGEPTPASDVDEMLDVFRWTCEAVASARGARVVLLLDTCEELERLGPDGRLPDSVERTFDLLQRLHAKMPALRVVLCGRRPLAGTYAGGDVVTSALPPQPWLRLHRVFAFSEDEARTYLQRASVPEPLVAPVLSRSVAAASSAALGLPPEDAALRYSPFSLSVYATWIAKQRDLDPEAILGDRVDHFVRIRILDRIGNEDVRRLLPHVALLGRFDDGTLRACVDIRSDIADAVLREIGSQEWIARQAGGYYAVEPELRTRLLQYFERESPRELQAARRRVEPELWSRLHAGADDQVPDEAVVQALVQMVRSDREAMLRAWRILDTRVVRGGQASWGMRVLGRLLADQETLACEAVDAGAWGAFVTTYAECVLHEQGAAHVADLWRRAWEAAQELQQPYERASVLVRVASGALATAASAPDTEIALDLWILRLSNLLNDRDVTLSAPTHLAPAIAAMMACADAIERQGDPLAPAQPMLERVASMLSSVSEAPARAIALTCVARFAARRQDADLARKRFHDALKTMSESSQTDVVPCLHWPPRLDPPSAVAFESLRGLAGLETVEDTLARVALVPPPRSAITANRIESLRLRLSAAIRVPDAVAASPSPAPAIGAGDVAPPESYGHVAVPPRAVAVALDHVESGRPAEGLRLLAELASVATSARNTVVATAAERARIEAVTRLRLGEHGRLSRQWLAGAGVLPLHERERMRAFIAEPPPHLESAHVLLDGTEAASLGDAHAIWRTRRAGDEATRLQLGVLGRSLLTSQPIEGQNEWARASVALDLVECSELGADVDLAAQGLTPISPEDWWSRHPALPEFALRLWMRSSALGVSPGGPTSLLVRRVGVRRAAALAMEEGELLALRLPTPALRLLALALTWYEDAHDVLGIWQVTTLLALTRVRAGVPRDGIDLTALQEVHAPLAARRGLLPWSAVASVTQLPLADTPELTEWTPWLHRIVALHHWVELGVRPEVLFSTPDRLPVELRDWPSDSSGGPTTGLETRISTPDGPSGLAAPTTQAVPPPAATVQTGSSRPAPVPSAPAPSKSASWSWWSLGAIVTAVIALLMLGWWLGGSRPTTSMDEPAGVSAASSSAEPGAGTPAMDEPGGNASGASGADADGVISSAPPLSPLVLLLAVAVPLLAVGVWLLRRRASMVVARPPAVPTWVARVTAGGGTPPAGRVGSLDVSVSLVDDHGAQVSVAPLRIRRTDAFSGLDALRQPPTGTLLSAPLPTTPPLQRVWLDLDVSTAWPCWEALLWSGVVDQLHLRPAVVRLVRGSVPPRHAVTPGAAAWPIASVAATAADERQAAYAWEPALRAGRAELTSVTAEAVRSGMPLRGIRLVHVTAQPVETPQGLFFEAAGGESLQEQESLESLAKDRGILFDASQIAHTFPDMTCALLQPPRRPVLDLTPAGREACACLRIIGASLAEQGVPLVIVLPPLDGESSAHVVRLLGRRLARLREAGSFDAHHFTSRARELTLGHAQRLLSRDAAIELALQITVHAR